MVDGMLSQEEIDALLSGTSFDAPSKEPTQARTSTPAGPIRITSNDLSAAEIKALGDRLRVGLGSAAEVSSTLIGRSLSLKPISIVLADDATISSELVAETAVFEFEFTGQVAGSGAVAMSSEDAALFADIMMGGDGSTATADLDELHQRAATEYLSSVVSGLATALSRELAMTISTGPLDVRIDGQTLPPLAGRGNRVLAKYAFDIEGVRSGQMFLVMDVSASRSIAGTKIITAGPKVGASSPGGNAPGSAKTVGVAAVQFPTLSSTLTEVQTKNIEILMDVSMQVTVELGRASMMIRDVLELGTGSIIELDKLAGEPVDLLVNSKLIARGEVVVIDESFGVRVTDIITPIERVKNLQ